MRRGRSSPSIDVTPLIDVMFMLIIFFVLTTAFVRGSIDVDLPEGSGQPVEGPPPVVVAVDASAAVTWEGVPVSLDELGARARTTSADILVAGDEGAPYGAVAAVLDALRGAGVASVGLAFDAR